MTDDFSLDPPKPTEPFDPLLLDKGVIAIPLLEQLQAEENAETKAGAEAASSLPAGPDELVAAIDLNANAISLRVAF